MKAEEEEGTKREKGEERERITKKWKPTISQSWSFMKFMDLSLFPDPDPIDRRRCQVLRRSKPAIAHQKHVA